MSIVESTLQKLKNARAGEPDKRSTAAPEPLEPPAAARSRARIPAAIRWPGDVPPAEIDLVRLEAAGLRPPEQLARRMADEFRAIRREVIGASMERLAVTGQTVGPIAAVTSAAPGDGKSHTALNLALSIAGQGAYEVLLIDADFVKRTISTACGLADRPGLAELLARPEASFLEYAYPVQTSRLHILPAGVSAQSAHDLFAPARVAAVFDAIRATMAEHIAIVDTPPILASSDTSVVLDCVGQVLFVVRAGNSLQDGVREALARVRKTLPVGVILNDWQPLLPAEKKNYRAHDEYTR